MDSLVSQPTKEQSLAIAILSNEERVIIFAWLTLFRSLQGTAGRHTAQGHLSEQQLRAIATLQDSPDDSIEAWLEAASGQVNKKSPLESGADTFSQTMSSLIYSLIAM